MSSILILFPLADTSILTPASFLSMGGVHQTSQTLALLKMGMLSGLVNDGFISLTHKRDSGTEFVFKK
jgi:hypothetical protein